MGLFDGVDPASGWRPDFGSTAHVARLLGAPVVLVVDAARPGARWPRWWPASPASTRGPRWPA